MQKIESKHPGFFGPAGPSARIASRDLLARGASGLSVDQYRNALIILILGDCAGACKPQLFCLFVFLHKKDQCVPE